MFDDQPREAPSSEDVALALRHCWQPVARIEDLEHGPQRAVLLGEALAVFLTESGEPAVVADRCAHRGASLSMGKVAGDSHPVPLPRLGVGRRRRRLHPDPLASRPAPDPAAAPGFRPSRCASSGGWSGPRWRSRSASRPTRLLVRRRHWTLGPWRRRSSCRSPSGDDRELPRRLPLRLRPPGDTLGAVAEVIEPLEPETRRARGDDAPEDGGRRRRGRDLGPAAGNATTTRSRPTSPRPDAHGRGRALPAARGARDQRHRVRALLDRGMASRTSTSARLDEAIDSDERLYAEDLAVISTVQPPELPLALDADVNTLADRFHPRLPGGLRASSWTRRPRARAAAYPPYSGMNCGLTFAHQLRLAVGEDVDRPGPGRVVIVLAVGEFAETVS